VQVERATLRVAAAKAAPECRSANALQFVAAGADIAEAAGSAADIAVAPDFARDIGPAAAEVGTGHSAHQPAGVAANFRRRRRIEPQPTQRQAPRRSAQRVRRFEP
jgi:hypothetical protein